MRVPVDATRRPLKISPRWRTSRALLAALAPSAVWASGLSPLAGPPGSAPQEPWVFTGLPGQTLPATRFLLERQDGRTVLRVQTAASTVLDRLTEVLFVQLLRYAMERQLIEGGVVAGLADARLARALTAMHDDPARDWSLASLAAKAGMSRSRFAARFASVVGVPAMEYLTRWRVGVAQGLLRRGRPPKVVAQEVGYGRSSTFGRAFAQVVGVTSTVWLRSTEG